MVIQNKMRTHEEIKVFLDKKYPICDCSDLIKIKHNYFASISSVMLLLLEHDKISPNPFNED